MVKVLRELAQPSCTDSQNEPQMSSGLFRGSGNIELDVHLCAK